MRNLAFVGLAAALSVVLCACASQRVQPRLTPVLIPDETSNGAEIWSNPADEECHAEGSTMWRRLNPPGRLTPRECVLRNLYRAGEEERFSDLQRYTAQLQGHYYLRSGRQQRFMDNGAGVTFIGALGAGLSGRVGVATQRAWLGVAFLPVLLTNVNANEPTRDLFHAGALGLGLVSRRYEIMHHALETLQATQGSALATPPPNCDGVARALRDVSAWPQGGDDRAAVLPEALRLTEACRSVDADYQNTEITLSALRALEAHWASDLANDAFALDRLLIYKDRQFRFSPSETVGAMAAAPFRTLDNFLSGQDTAQALKTMQTVMAFENMNVTLSQMQVPARHEATATVTMLSPQARARATAQNRANGPSLSRLTTALETLDRTARELSIAQNRQAYRSQVLSEFYDLAAARYLVFTFSPTSGVVSVELRSTLPPPPVASAQGEPAASPPSTPQSE